MSIKDREIEELRQRLPDKVFSIKNKIAHTRTM